MIEIIEKLKQTINRLSIFFSRPAADSGKGQLKLRFGSFKEMLVKKRNQTFTARGKFINEESNLAWAKRKGTFCISTSSESNPHIVISGMSGFGKSTLFKSLLSQIVNSGVSCLIFDAHNEHASIVRTLNGEIHNALYAGINILELDGASVSERISELTRLFKEVYSLGYIQATKLSECLWYTYRKAGARSKVDRQLQHTPKINDLLDELNIFIRNSKSQSENHTLLHLKDRISLLSSTAFSGGTMKMESLITGLNSFSLANIKGKEAKLIYIGELLGRLYAMMHDGKKDSLKLYIMIDEAQFLIDNSDNNPVISKLIEEGRKYGIGVIIVTHAATTLNRKIIANSSVFLSFYAREPSEVSYISKIFSGGGPSSETIRERIKYLKQNEAMLVSSNFRLPVIILTPTFDEIKEEARADLGENEAMELLGIIAKRPVKINAVKSKEPNLPDSIIRKLILSRFLDYFTLQDNAKEEWIMRHNPSLSIEHEVWVMKISETLNGKNITNKIIDNSKGPDIVAFHSGRKIAIEYETGSKSTESTSKMIDSRISDYDEIVIVTKNELIERYKERFTNPKIRVIGSSNISLMLTY